MGMFSSKKKFYRVQIAVMPAIASLTKESEYTEFDQSSVQLSEPILIKNIDVMFDKGLPEDNLSIGTLEGEIKELVKQRLYEIGFDYGHNEAEKENIKELQKLLDNDENTLDEV